MDRLFIFDVDGTLLQSVSLQMSCLREALLQVYENEFLSWGEKNPTSTTDRGILYEISRELRGRPPLDEEETRFNGAFLSAIEELLHHGHCVTPTVGADFVLSSYFRSTYSIAIATGGFQNVSRLKMQRAGLAFDGIPAAFAEDGFTKEEVLSTALLRAELQLERKFKEIIYFGDASYDISAAAALGFKFVGVGDESRRKRLADCGAKVTIPNFMDLERLLVEVF